MLNLFYQLYYRKVAMKISNYRRSTQGSQQHQLLKEQQSFKKKDIFAIKFLNFKQRANIFNNLKYMNVKRDLHIAQQNQNKQVFANNNHSFIKIAKFDKKERYSFPCQKENEYKSYNSYSTLQKQCQIKIYFKQMQPKSKNISLQQKVAQSIKKLKNKMLLPPINSEDNDKQNQSLDNLSTKDVLVEPKHQRKSNTENENTIYSKNSLKSSLKIYKKQLNKFNETFCRSKQLFRQFKNIKLISPQFHSVLGSKMLRNKTEQYEIKSRMNDRENLSRWGQEGGIQNILQYDEFES